MTFALPSSLNSLRETESGALWCEDLPAIFEACVSIWNLKVGVPYVGGSAAYVAPVTRSDGSEAVLKIQFPHRECEHEAAALAVWNGRGAVQLLEHDVDQHALLLERCEPGTLLADASEINVLEVVADLLPRLWIPPPQESQFTTLADEAAWWRSTLEEEWHSAGMPFEQSLLAATLEILDELPQSQGEQILVNQDLHGKNIISSQRQEWLAIDPKPLIGEREFSLVPIIRSFELGHSEESVIGRLNRLSFELNLDRERVRLWTFAHTIVTSCDRSVQSSRLETARWLMSA